MVFRLNSMAHSTSEANLRVDDGENEGDEGDDLESRLCASDALDDGNAAGNSDDGGHVHIVEGKMMSYAPLEVSTLDAGNKSTSNKMPTNIARRIWNAIRGPQGSIPLCTRNNAAIPVFYWTLGVLMKLPYVALRIYLIKDLRISPSQQALVFGVVLTVPWNFKMVYG